MNQRPTRLRRINPLRRLVREQALRMEQIIFPVFIVEGTGIKEEISSMKGQYRYSLDLLLEALPGLRNKGISNLLLFGTPSTKDMQASSAYAANGVIQTAIKAINQQDPNMLIITDICLCGYKADGHCCIYHEDGRINRKDTLALLGEIALSHARAGAHMIAPSDMMDGRIGYIRRQLDQNGFEHIPIMAYSAKFASSFYGPFREAVDSAPLYGDRKGYQMDIGNSREALKEMLLDIEEGADIIMVKPAMPYLDIIKAGKEETLVPMAAYQVSGEYAMIQNAVDAGLLSRAAIYESLMSIKRSGADLIISYFAPVLQDLLREVE